MKHPSAKDPLRLLLAASGKFPVIVATIDDILGFAHKTETVTISQWTEERWYIEVRDETMFAKVRNGSADERIRCTRFMLSVDVKNDRILFNSQGGNCMARGRRWQNFANADLSNAMRAKELHLYR